MHLSGKINEWASGALIGTMSAVWVERSNSNGGELARRVHA
jgi:hypothetical protein